MARPRFPAIIAIASALAASACGGTHDRPHPALPPAAEPASAPVPAHPPAGRSVRVGTLPEGIAVDARSGDVIVAVRDPARLVVLSARSGRVLERVPIPAAPRHLALAGPGGPVLVPAEPVNRLLELSLPSGSVDSIPVGAQPHDAAAAAGRVFVGNELGRSVSVIVGGRAIARIGGFVQPGGLAATGEVVAVVDVRANTVTLIDARSLHIVARAPAGAGPTHVVADDTRLFVADTRGDALLSYDTQPKLRLTRRLALPGTPYGIAVDRVHSRLWVTLTARDVLAEFAIDGLSLRPIASYPTGRQPNTVGVDPRDGRVFVADADSGVVQLIDPPR